MSFARQLSRRRLWRVAGFLLGGILVWYCIQGTNIKEVLPALARFSLIAVLCAAWLLWLSLPLRALQWQVLLGAEHVSTGLLLRLTCLGAAVNVIVPLRGGEAAKVLLLHRLAGVPLRRAAVSLVLCRLQDVLPIGTVFLLAAWHYRHVGFAGKASLSVVCGSEFGWGLVAGFGIVLMATVLCVAWLAKASALTKRGLDEASALWRAMPSIGPLLLGQALAFACWGLFALSAVPLALSIGFTPWPEALRTAITVSVWTTSAALLPAAPGGVGTVHASCMAALYSLRPELGREDALAFAIILHAVGTFGPALPALFLRPRSAITHFDH